MPERLNIDAAVIGAGVEGLAVARALALAGHEVVVFEQGPAIGRETSSHNSGVIHSSINNDHLRTPYKAQFCRIGNEMFYAYCDNSGVPYKKTGKLTVATSYDQIPRLDKIKRQAVANGVTDLQDLGSKDIRELEPNVCGVQGLFSPSTGIVDVDQLMKSIESDAKRAGAVIRLDSPVLGGRVEDNGIELSIGDREGATVLCKKVINCAGLYASIVARSIEGIPPESIPETYYAKGNYFTVTDKPFKHLVYPMPVEGGLGVHVTLDLEGNVRFGPDVEWIDQLGSNQYDVDSSRAESFYAAIRRYYPQLRDGSLQPGYSGIRPKLSRQGEPERDFMIRRDGCYVGLYGIESPGLTASLAIAKYVKKLLEG